MTRAYFSKKVTLNGSAVAGAIITITDHATGEAVDAYSTKDGVTALSSITTAVNGDFGVWLEEGAYNMAAAYGGQVVESPNIIVENWDTYSDITDDLNANLSGQTSVTVAASGTGVFYGKTVVQTLRGITTIDGFFSNYTMDSDASVDLSEYMSEIINVDITRKDSGTSSDLPADHLGAVVTFNRNNDIAGSSPFYFRIRGIAL